VLSIRDKNSFKSPYKPILGYTSLVILVIRVITTIFTIIAYNKSISFLNR